MDRSEAEADLWSSATDTRLAAARYFASNARRSDVQMLQRAASQESVPWIRRALSLAIDRAQKTRAERVAAKPLSPTAELGSDSESTASVMAKATEDVTHQLVHEIAPIVGTLRMSATREWQGFTGSDTDRALQQLARLLESLRELNRAAATPRFELLSLSDVVASVCGAASIPPEIRVHRVGPPELSVMADRGQLELALSNGLRNALEAVGAWSRTTPPQVTISWGATAAENWLVIKDTGPGFPGTPESCKRRGTTGKDHHVGYGLALAEQAMSSMDGEIIVKNYDGGAHFELRWYKKNEDSRS